MAVIFTSRAAGTPMTTPTAIAPTISPKRLRFGVAKVNAIASAIPRAPMRLPIRAPFGLERPFRARMKQTAAMRSARRMPVPMLNLTAAVVRTGSGGGAGPARERPLNISSIRSVTTKPPTTFSVASTTATKPRTICVVPFAVPSTVIAPTRMTPWMAFVPDMSGVCRMLGTFEMTSKPTKEARTKTVRSPRMSVPLMCRLRR